MAGCSRSTGAACEPPAFGRRRGAASAGRRGARQKSASPFRRTRRSATGGRSTAPAGSDTLTGDVRPQDEFGQGAFGASDGIDTLTDMTCGLIDFAIGGVRAKGSGRGVFHEQGALVVLDPRAGRIMVDAIDDLQPLDFAADTPPLTADVLVGLGLHELIVRPPGRPGDNWRPRPSPTLPEHRDA